MEIFTQRLISSHGPPTASDSQPKMPWAKADTPGQCAEPLVSPHRISYIHFNINRVQQKMSYQFYICLLPNITIISLRTLGKSVKTAKLTSKWSNLRTFRFKYWWLYSSNSVYIVILIMVAGILAAICIITANYIYHQWLFLI